MERAQKMPKVAKVIRSLFDEKNNLKATSKLIYFHLFVLGKK